MNQQQAANELAALRARVAELESRLAEIDAQQSICAVVKVVRETDEGFIQEIAVEGPKLPYGTELYTRPAAPQPVKECEWKHDTSDYEYSVYDTACGNRFQFTEGGPSDNDMAFCPYCGGKLAEVKEDTK